MRLLTFNVILGHSTHLYIGIYRPVVELRGGPRGPGPPERPGGPLETPGLRGYKGASKPPPLKSPVKFNT